MARGRLVSRTLGSSRKFAALSQTAGKLAEFAQTLYPLLVANSDDYGRMAGDAFTVKHAVFPTSRRKEGEFRLALNAMHNSGLIRLYDAEGQLTLQIEQFDEHQPGLSKRTKSKFPGPPVNFTEIPESPGSSGATEGNRTEFKGTEGKRREEDQNLPTPKARRDFRPVENSEKKADEVSPTVRDQPSDPGSGAGDAGRGVESPDQGTDVSSRLRVSGAGDAVSGDECSTGGSREGERSEAESLVIADLIRAGAEAGRIAAAEKREKWRRSGVVAGSRGSSETRH